MTDKHFDNLTKLVSSSASRRSVLKGLVAAALGGVLTRAGGGEASATRSRRACSRLHQACGAGGYACCPGLACGEDATCCVPENGSCIQDTDCCAGDVCRPNPSGLGARCLPPGLLGDLCIDDADCAGGFCDTYSGTCGDSGCSTCPQDLYAGPTICGFDSTTNDICACYPTTQQTCACSASNGCEMTSGGCESSADCNPGEVCIVPLGEPDICGYGPTGVCGLPCDMLGSPNNVNSLSMSGGWIAR